MPPGETSVRARAAMIRDPLAMLLDAYERYGPIFTLRDLPRQRRLHARPGGEPLHAGLARRQLPWRDGHIGDLIPLLGDGLLTIDGDFHRRSRRIMLPAFHRERIAAATRLMEEEVERGARAAGAPGDESTSTLDPRAGAADRDARAVRLRPRRGRARLDAAEEFERALAFYGARLFLQILRGPRHAVRADAARAARWTGSSTRRSTAGGATGERGEDILSLLLDAERRGRRPRSTDRRSATR